MRARFRERPLETLDREAWEALCGSSMVNHTRMAVLYGPRGRPIAIVPHDQGAAGVAAELERWVR
jgi:hypothetical protein